MHVNAKKGFTKVAYSTKSSLLGPSTCGWPALVGRVVSCGWRFQVINPYKPRKPHEPRKNLLALVSIESWLFNGDPVYGLRNNLHITAYSIIPYIIQNNQGFFIAHMQQQHWGFSWWVCRTPPYVSPRFHMVHLKMAPELGNHHVYVPCWTWGV